MSRALLIAAVWAVLIALTALLAHLAGPDQRARGALSSDTFAFAVVPRAPDAGASTGTDARAQSAPDPVKTSSATAPEAQSTTPAPPAEQPPAQTAPAPAPTLLKPSQPVPAQKRVFPQKEGGTESGIPGLGALPPGPGAAYQGLGVQVYSRQTGQPVPGARVRFALQEQLDEWQRAHPDTPIELADPERILEICAQPVTTRAYGVALADSAPGRMLVDARSGTQYGFVWVDRDKDARARIDMVEDHALSVRVVDSNGVPLANRAVLVRDSGCADLWRAVTDSNGKARWPHASFIMERDASPGSCIAMAEFIIAIPVTPSSRELPRPFKDPGEIELVLPTSSVSLRVNVVDGAGKPVDEPLRLRCAVWLGNCAGEVTRTLKNGTATFDHVDPGCGPEIRIEGGSVFENALRHANWPWGEGGTTATVTCGRRYPVVRARLLEPNGNPIAKKKVTAWLEFVELGTALSLEAMERVETDDAGNVRLTLPYAPFSIEYLPVLLDAAATAKQRLLIVAQNEFGDWCHAETIDIPTLTESELDLGERRLAEMPTIAAGYVLADKGWPVPNAIVEVSASDDPAADPESFTRDARFDTMADQMGRFRLRGLVPGARVALTASAPNHVRPPRRVIERGDRKIALEITRCASLQGRILLPFGVTPERAHVWIDGADEAIPAVIDASLAWRCASLPPGTVGLHVNIDGYDEPVYAVPSLTLLPGVELNDPQTTTIDLRTRVTRFLLNVTSAHGKPIAMGTAVVTEPREEGPYTRTVAIENGVLEVIALRPAVDIEISAAGFETQVLRAVTAGRDVELVPAKGN